MVFNIFYQDNATESFSYENIDVTEINRKQVQQFEARGEDWFIAVDVPSGCFNINGLIIPFAFHSSTTQFVLFRRMQIQVNGSEPQIFAIVFGLRNTITLPDGKEKNHTQLIWIFPNGTVSIGGNK